MKLYVKRLDHPNYGFAVGTSWALWLYVQIFNFQVGLEKSDVQGDS
jgi:hypothetical protein